MGSFLRTRLSKIFRRRPTRSDYDRLFGKPQSEDMSAEDFLKYLDNAIELAASPDPKKIKKELKAEKRRMRK